MSSVNTTTSKEKAKALGTVMRFLCFQFSFSSFKEHEQKFKDACDLVGIKNPTKTPLNKIAQQITDIEKEISAEDRQGRWCRMCGGACDLINCGMEQP